MKDSTQLKSTKDGFVKKRKKNKLLSNSSHMESSDVLVSAVISPYLLTHLHQILQKSEFNAKRDGRLSHASNFAKLRKVLCLDARSMEDASAKELNDSDNEIYINNNKQNVA